MVKTMDIHAGDKLNINRINDLKGVWFYTPETKTYTQLEPGSYLITKVSVQSQSAAVLSLIGGKRVKVFQDMLEDGLVSIKSVQKALDESFAHAPEETEKLLREFIAQLS